ncbi:MAG: hypothetical protein A2096_00990 [Spirochaetes bacterium GWF1_41_5]|nr:MAG: hypothetical protein A2096_00990 [Spirochaetes bacterium GWF1_41_5]
MLYLGAFLPAWYSNYRYRKALTNNFALSGDLADFPVCIVISNDTDLANGASNIGEDILFTGSDGCTKIAHELEFYTNCGTIAAWVKIPYLSATQTASNIIYIYYDKKQNGGRQDPANLWDSNYIGVWHFNNSSNDSSANNNHPSGATGIRQTNGMIGRAYEFSNGYIEYPYNASLNTSTAVTISAWVQLRSLGMHHTFVSRDRGAVNNNYYFMVYNSDKALGASYNGGTQYHIYGQSAFQAADLNTWIYLVYTDDGNTRHIYSNGVYFDGTTGGANPHTIGTDSEELTIGSASDELRDRRIYGALDEVRISRVVRTSNWIATSYSNQANPVCFIRSGVQEKYPNVIISRFSPSSFTPTVNYETIFTVDAEIITGDIIVSLALDFGNGRSLFRPCSSSNISDEKFIHTYESTGNYIVVLTARSGMGYQATNSFMLSVLPCSVDAPYNLICTNTCEGVQLAWNIYSGAYAKSYRIFRDGILWAVLNNTSSREYLDECIVYGKQYEYFIETTSAIGSVFSGTNRSASHDQHRISEKIGIAGGRIANLLASFYFPAGSYPGSREIVLSVLSNDYRNFTGNPVAVYNQVGISADNGDTSTDREITITFRIPVINNIICFRNNNQQYLLGETKTDFTIARWGHNNIWQKISTGHDEKQHTENFTFLKLSAVVNTLGVYGVIYNPDHNPADYLWVENRIFAPGYGHGYPAVTRIFFPNPASKTVMVLINNMNGITVFSKNFSSSTAQFSWDGRGRHSRYEKAGAYIVSVLIGNENEQVYNTCVYIVK